MVEEKKGRGERQWRKKNGGGDMVKKEEKGVWAPYLEDQKIAIRWVEKTEQTSLLTPSHASLLEKSSRSHQTRKHRGHAIALALSHKRSDCHCCSCWMVGTRCFKKKKKDQIGRAFVIQSVTG